MPSNKKSSKSAAESLEGSAAASAVSETDTDTVEDRLDLMEALEVGAPGLAPLPVTFRGIDFAIKRYYPPEVIWEWSDLQRKDSDTMKPTEVAESNKKILSIIIADEFHDVIDDLLAAIGDRSIPEARRVYAFMNMKAGLTDRWGNPLAL